MLFQRRVIHQDFKHNKRPKPNRWILSSLATFIFAAATLEIIITTTSSTITVKADNGVISAAGGLESNDSSNSLRVDAVSTTARPGAEGAAAVTSRDDSNDSSKIQMMRKMLSESNDNDIIADADDLEHLLVSKISVDQFDSSFGSDEDDVTGVQTGDTTKLVGAGSSFAKRLHQVRL